MAMVIPGMLSLLLLSCCGFGTCMKSESGSGHERRATSIFEKSATHLAPASETETFSFNAGRSHLVPVDVSLSVNVAVSTIPTMPHPVPPLAPPQSPAVPPASSSASALAPPLALTRSMPMAMGEVRGQGMNMLILSDDGKDTDDELAKILAAALWRRGFIRPLAYVAPLFNQIHRARLAKGILKALGLGMVPVAPGRMMQDRGAENFTGWTYYDNTDISELYTDGFDSNAPEDCMAGANLLREQLRKLHATSQKATLVVLSGYEDILSLLLSGNLGLFRATVEHVVIMGGENGRDANDREGPGSPEYLRETLAKDVNLTILSRQAAYNAALKLGDYTNGVHGFRATGHPVGVHIAEQAVPLLVNLWNTAKSNPVTKPVNAQWYMEKFLGGKDNDPRLGENGGANDEATELARLEALLNTHADMFPYDALALMAGVPKLKRLFFTPGPPTDGAFWSKAQASAIDVIGHEHRKTKTPDIADGKKDGLVAYMKYLIFHELERSMDPAGGNIASKHAANVKDLLGDEGEALINQHPPLSEYGFEA